ncbi:hypothetical protein MLD38_004364 [Melastoma candidum]|uniref:Uncharacterized protein n=1 Tax=Melastoma candidum TaxID=119954 RepID=A0ACB9S6S6_9MYRT|nr:hypothetical protein MLD38_004364 [Melastoma candidum]
MQFDRGYLSKYFANNRRKMTVEFYNCKLLLVDKKITNPKDNAVKEKYPIILVAEGIEPEAMDIAILTRGRVIREDKAIH